MTKLMELLSRVSRITVRGLLLKECPSKQDLWRPLRLVFRWQVEGICPMLLRMKKRANSMSCLWEALQLPVPLLSIVAKETPEGASGPFIDTSDQSLKVLLMRSAVILPAFTSRSRMQLPQRSLIPTSKLIPSGPFFETIRGSLPREEERPRSRWERIRSSAGRLRPPLRRESRPTIRGSPLASLQHDTPSPFNGKKRPAE